MHVQFQYYLMLKIGISLLGRLCQIAFFDFMKWVEVTILRLVLWSFMLWDFNLVCWSFAMQSGLTWTHFFFFVLFGKIHVCWDKDSFFPFCFDSWQSLNIFDGTKASPPNILTDRLIDVRLFFFFHALYSVFTFWAFPS